MGAAGVGEGESDVSVAFTGDATEFETTLDDMAEKTDTITEEISAAFQTMADDVTANIQEIKDQVDELNATDVNIDAQVTGDAEENLTAIQEAKDNLEKDPAVDLSVDEAGTADQTIQRILNNLTILKEDYSHTDLTVEEQGDAQTIIEQIKKDLQSLQDNPDATLTVNDEGNAADKVEKVKTDLDELRSDPEATITVNDEGNAAKNVEQVKTDLDELQSKGGADISVDDTGNAADKIRTIKLDLDDLRTIYDSTDVAVEESGNANRKLDEIIAKVETLRGLGDTTIPIDVTGGHGGEPVPVPPVTSTASEDAQIAADDASEQVANDVTNEMSTQLPKDMKGKAPKLKTAADQGIGNLLSDLKFTASDISPFVSVKSLALGPAIAGAAGVLLMAAASSIGVGGILTAMTGSKNTMKMNFETELDHMLTTFDKEVADAIGGQGKNKKASAFPKEGALLGALLTNVQTMLNEMITPTELMAKGLTQWSKALEKVMTNPSFKQLMDEVTKYSASTGAEWGTIVGNFMEGIGRLLVAAEPFMTGTLSAIQSMSQTFNSKGGQAAESGFFQDLSNMLDKNQQGLTNFFEAIGNLAEVVMKAVAEVGPTILNASADIVKVYAAIGSLITSVLSGLGSLGEGNTAVAKLVAYGYLLTKLSPLIKVLFSSISKLTTVPTVPTVPTGSKSIGEQITTAGDAFNQSTGEAAANFKSVVSSAAEDVKGDLTAGAATAQTDLEDSGKVMQTAADEQVAAAGEQTDAGLEQITAATENTGGGVGRIGKILKALGVGDETAAALSAVAPLAATFAGAAGLYVGLNKLNTLITGFGKKGNVSDLLSIPTSSNPNPTGATGHYHGHPPAAYISPLNVKTMTVDTQKVGTMQTTTSTGAPVTQSTTTNKEGFDLSQLVMPGLTQANSSGKKAGVAYVQALETAINDVMSGTTVVPKSIKNTLGASVISEIEQDFTDKTPAAAHDLINGITQVLNNDWSAPNSAYKWASHVTELINQGFGTHSPSTITTQTGKDVVQGLINGMTNNGMWETLTSKVDTKLKDLLPTFQAAGTDWMTSLAAGITAGQQAVVSAAEQIAYAAVGAVRTVLSGGVGGVSNTNTVNIGLTGNGALSAVALQQVENVVLSVLSQSANATTSVLRSL